MGGLNTNDKELLRGTFPFRLLRLHLIIEGWRKYPINHFASDECNVSVAGINNLSEGVASTLKTRPRIQPV